MSGEKPRSFLHNQCKMNQKHLNKGTAYTTLLYIQQPYLQDTEGNF